MAILRVPFLLMLLFLQSARLALSQIWANKVRAALTLIGITISVAAVCAVVAALSGMKANILTEFESFGASKMYIIASRPKEGPLRTASWWAIRFTPETFDGMRAHCPSIEDFTPVCQTRTTVRHGEREEESVEVLGILPSWHRIENRPVELGRSFSVVDNDQARPVCLITPTLRDELRLARDCRGTPILVGQRFFRIVGVTEEQAEFQALQGVNQSRSQVLVPLNTAWKANPNSGVYVIATSRSPELSEEAVAEVRFYLRRVRRLKPGEPDTFRLEVMERYIEQFEKVAAAVTAVAAGVVGISLLVGGVGIMNIMLVSVSERTREIGLRKAVGATPAAILLQFLLEAITLCLLGGLIGVAGGQAMAFAARQLPETYGMDRTSVPIWAIVMAFGFSAGVGIIFGMFPAIKASRLDPIEALRHE